MKFSKDKFLKQANNFDKRLFSKYLNEMDGKKVCFAGNKYGFVYFDDGDYIYPIYEEWCINE